VASDDGVRDARLRAHARHLRDHVDRLAAKAYWAALSPAPEFVVLFIPGEAFLAPALDHDPGLLEYAVARRVHIATPTTLISLLRTAQYAWQQEALSDNARAVFDVGRELYERISGLGERVDQLGKALTGAVTAYNKTVGSLETRVLVSARRLQQLGIVDTDQEAPRLVEQTSRTLSAPELTAVTAADPPPAAPEPREALELTSATPGRPAATPTAAPGPAGATPDLFAAEPEPADRTGAVPDPSPSPGPATDRGTEPPELVMTHINGAAR